MSLMEGGTGGGLRTLKERGGQREWRHNNYFSDKCSYYPLALQKFSMNESYSCGWGANWVGKTPPRLSPI